MWVNSFWAFGWVLRKEKIQLFLSIFHLCFARVNGGFVKCPDCKSLGVKAVRAWLSAKVVKTLGSKGFVKCPDPKNLGVKAVRLC